MGQQKGFTGLRTPPRKQTFGTTAMHRSRLWSHHAARRSWKHGRKCPRACISVHVKRVSCLLAIKQRCRYANDVCLSHSSNKIKMKGSQTNKMTTVQWICDEWTKCTPCVCGTTLACIDEVQTSRLFSRMKHKKQPLLAEESCSSAIIPFRTKDAHAFRALEWSLLLASKQRGTTKKYTRLEWTISC